MKKIIRIVLTIQFALMLTHCATTSTDDLYRTYAACREQTLHPKVSENGIVQVNKAGEVIMVYKTGSCPVELQAYEEASILKEKRRRDREAYDALTSSCGKATLVCSGRGVSQCISRAGVVDRLCRCQCMSPWQIRRLLGGGIMYRHAVDCAGPRPVTE